MAEFIDFLSIDQTRLKEACEYLLANTSDELVQSAMYESIRKRMTFNSNSEKLKKEQKEEFNLQRNIDRRDKVVKELRAFAKSSGNRELIEAAIGSNFIDLEFVVSKVRQGEPLVLKDAIIETKVPEFKGELADLRLDVVSIELEKRR